MNVVFSTADPTLTDSIPLADAARRLGLLCVTVRASIRGGFLHAIEPNPGDYHIPEHELRRFANAVGRPLVTGA